MDDPEHRAEPDLRRLPFRTVIALVAITMLTIACAAAGPLPLDPLTPAQWRGAGVGGTGCFWMDRPNGSVFMAMADDMAVASIGGKLAVLSPDRGARDLFPFTYDRWRRGGTAIAVRKVGATRRVGTETLGGRTDLMFTHGGHRVVLRGTMGCGT